MDFQQSLVTDIKVIITGARSRAYTAVNFALMEATGILAAGLWWKNKTAPKWLAMVNI